MQPPAALPPALAAQLAALLEPHEHVIWSGQPVPRNFRRSAYVIVPCGIVILALALHWLRPAHGFWLVPLGLLFLFGLALVAAPYLLHRSAGTTVYAITDRRALMFDAATRSSSRAYRLAELTEWETKRHADASGDLVLETEYIDDHDGNLHARQHGFFAIADVRAVERILEGVREGEETGALLRRAWM